MPTIKGLSSQEELIIYRKRFGDIVRKEGGTKVYSEKSKKWKIPFVVCEDRRFKPRAYDVLGYREVKKGELFLSGAVPTAYRAMSDMKTKYLVIEFQKDI